jgi:hypothetical protein
MKARKFRTFSRRTLLCFIVIIIAVAGVLPGLVSIGHADAISSTLTPIADTYVNSGSTSANYGTATTLSQSTSANRALMRFDTSSVPVGSTISAVTLKLYTLSTPSSGGIRVHPEIDSWNETTTTWGNQPTWNSAIVATTPKPVNGTWISVSLPVSSVVAGNKTSYGFDYSVANNVVLTASRESANDAQLIVAYTTAGGITSTAPTATTGASSGITAGSANVLGTASANGAATACHFAYGVTASYGQTTADQTLAATASNVSVTAAVAGLQFNTVYNYRIECTNSNGTTFGSNATFKTAAGGPTVTTGSSSNIAATSATVSGSGSDNGAATTCRFDYGPTTSYGSQTAVQSIAAGSGAVALTASIAGLTPATAYNYRLECTNSGGNGYGANGTFTTLAQGPGGGPTTATLIPVADSYITSGSSSTNYGTKTTMVVSGTTNRALLKFDSSSIPAGSTVNSVTLRIFGINSQSAAGIVVHPEQTTWTESGVTWANQPAWNSTSLATSAKPATNTWLPIVLPTSSVTVAGSTSFGLAYSSSGYTENLASREDATNKPQLVVTYTPSGPPATAPSVTTGSSTNASASSTTISGTANDNGTATTCRFDYGLTTAYGTQTAVQNVAVGAGPTALSADLTNLAAGSTYNYRLECTNGGGTVFGLNNTVMTMSTAPTAVTGAASSVGSAGFTLAGSAAPNGADSTCAFDYGLTTDYGTQTALQTVLASVSTSQLTAPVSDLTPSTLYNYRLECTNANGTTYGANATVTTTAVGAAHNVTKILTIVEENHGYTQMQAGMPYLNGLAQQYGYANNFHAIGHPSLPNYVALVSGSTYGITSDCTVSSCPVSGAQTIFDQTITAGKTAKVYAEDMTSNCMTSGSGVGKYAVRHTAWPYFTDTASRANCNQFQVTAGTYQSGAFNSDVTSGTLPNVGMLIPNLCNDAHDCGLSTADAWLKNILPLVFAGPDWQSGHLAIVVTTDEDEGTQLNQILTVVMHPDLQNKVATTSMDLYSLTRLQEQVAGVPNYLNNAATANDMAQAFGLPVGP